MNGFYYCNLFNPTWEELCEKLDKKMINFNKYERAEINIRDTPTRIQTEYGKSINSFPTILIKLNNKYYKYQEERTFNSIINFILHKLDENDILYKYLHEKFGEIITKNNLFNDNNGKMNGGMKNNKVNYRTKYKKYKQMYADLAIKYNDLKKQLHK